MIRENDECCIVKDLLPLYNENMLGEGSARFVGEHLAVCSECSAETEAISAKKVPKEVSEGDKEINRNEALPLKKMKKKLRNKLLRAFIIAFISVLAVLILLYHFPFYRVIGLRGAGRLFDGNDLLMLASIGSSSDRAEAQSVLRQADEAFNDTKHTRAENEEKYGLLARYSTSIDSYPSASFNEHSLELLSAHLGETEGSIWVKYSSRTYTYDGEYTNASNDVESLWIVEKNENGEWVVVKIKEHP